MATDQLEPGQSDGIFLPDGEGWGFGPRATGILLTQVQWTMGPPAVRAEFLESL